MVKVLLPRSLRAYWGGDAEVAVDAETVAAAVRALGAKHPGLAARILDERGRPRTHVHLFVNQEAVHQRDLDGVRLREGDTLHVLPAVSGGASDVRKGSAVVVAGTRKGVFLLHSRDRRRWKVEGPWFEGQDVYHATLDPRDGKTVWAGVTSAHWGPTVQRTRTWGARWLRDADQPRFPEGSGAAVTRVWHVEPGVDGDLWAGVEPAGLFRSTDGGKTWQGVEGLNAHPTRPEWMPGGGGLCLHTILPHPKDPRRVVAAASAVGVLESRDAGLTWHLRNGNVRADHLPLKVMPESAPGSCPHKLVRDPLEPGTLWMQNHFGVYRRREDEDKWTDVGKGLPSRFGFPMVAHPRERTIYTVPLEADMNRVTPGGAMAVWRLRDGARSWSPLRKGLPQENAWVTVLREGMATDGKDPAGLYVGTTGGEVWASRDEGASWALAAQRLPPVLSVSAGVAQ